MASLFVSGIARARRLKRAKLALMARARGGAEGAWTIVAADVDGRDLARDEQVLRVAWSAPVAGAGAVRRELILLSRVARRLTPHGGVTCAGR